VLSIEASRLARNGRDWHTLLEFCSVVGALLIDAEGIYDPALMNDPAATGNERHDQRDGAGQLQAAGKRGNEAEWPGAGSCLFACAHRLMCDVATSAFEKDPDERVKAAPLTWHSASSQNSGRCGRPLLLVV